MISIISSLVSLITNFVRSFFKPGQFDTRRTISYTYRLRRAGNNDLIIAVYPHQKFRLLVFLYYCHYAWRYR